VIGIFFGLLCALITSFYSLNLYMQNCLNVTPLSIPMFPTTLSHFINQTVIRDFTISYLFGAIVVFISFYICV
jgi:hypothetical protein